MQGAQIEGAGVTIPPVVAIAIVLFSLLIPTAIFIGRSLVKKNRQKLLDDLGEAFNLSDVGKNLAGYIPSFEFARVKYEMPGTGTDGPRHFGQFWQYLIPCTIYVVISALGFAATLILPRIPDYYAAPNWVLLGLSDATGTAIVDYQRTTAAAICIGFTGAYIWSVTYLIRRITNYDLTPLSFLRVSTHILLVAFTVAVLRHAFLGDATGAIGRNAMAAVAFLVGFFPTLGVDYLIERFAWLQLKRNDKAAKEVARSLPLDMIDGIDTFTQFRLGEFEIEDVQNLATANPVVIFVETPYGLFEVIDWIAQAQLIVAVGPPRYKLLREAGVRTIFDLARMGQHPVTRARMLKILLPGESGPLDDEQLFDTVFIGLADDLHVLRLAQLWNALSAMLASEGATDVATLDRLDFKNKPVPRPRGGNLKVVSTAVKETGS